MTEYDPIKRPWLAILLCVISLLMAVVIALLARAAE